jgi:hypothetical protein
MFEGPKNYSEPGASTEKIKTVLMTPKQIFRRLIKEVHPDKGGNHQLALDVLDAYESAKNGDSRALSALYEKHFPGNNEKLEDDTSSVEEEPDEFENEEKIRKEIFDIIFFELDELFYVAIKRRDASMIKNHGLQVRYRNLCAERGVSFSSEYRGMKYDQKDIFDKLYNSTKSMVNEIKAMRRK